jgi:arylsulfatase A-like enzyme
MSATDKDGHELSRRELIGAGAGAAAAAAVGSRAPLARASAAAGPKRSFAGMNVVMFLTDQDRAIQHFPPGWARKNLPGLMRLRRHGISFENAFTNACMCSPARSTLMTGYFPAQHRVKYTLEEDMPRPPYPQVEMPLPGRMPNLATVAASAGYAPVYKGKWHISKPEGEQFEPSDLTKYGWTRWNPPDGGANQDIDQAGGGTTDNDGRYMNDAGDVDAGEEGVLAYLSSAAAQQQPFFLVVSLVNPHDVLFYPNTYIDAGYDDSWLKGTIGLPETVDEDLRTKPDVQAQFLRIFNLTGKLKTPKMKRDYLNFYGNLMKSSDNYLVQVLDALGDNGLIDDTLVIRTADHGEMGLAHGGLRQKNFNFYEESLRVPLVYSNTKLFKKPQRSQALVSHVDFLPTVASLIGAPKSARAKWEGRDYSAQITRRSAPPPQDYVVFTYDDFQSGQKNPPYPDPPNHIVSVRERRWKLAKYYDPKGKHRPQWEMYDLKSDPLEKRNLAWPGHKRTKLQEKQFKRLKRKLARIQRHRLKPLG